MPDSLRVHHVGVDRINEEGPQEWSTEFTVVDPKGRSIKVEQGKLFLRENGKEQLLADFSVYLPDPTPSPEWALQW